MLDRLVAPDGPPPLHAHARMLDADGDTPSGGTAPWIARSRLPGAPPPDPPGATGPDPLAGPDSSTDRKPEHDSTERAL